MANTSNKKTDLITLSREIYDRLPSFVIMLDDDGKFVYANPAFQNFIGYDMQSLKQLSIDSLLIDSTENENNYHVERCFIHRNCTLLWGRCFTIKDDSNPTFRTIIIQDITLQKKKEWELKLATERLELGASSANIGIWDWDIASDIVTWNKENYTAYDIPTSQVVNYQAWEDAVHPEDLPGAIQWLEKVMSSKNHSAH